MKVNANNKAAIYEIIRGELNDLPGEKAHIEMYPMRISANQATKDFKNYKDSSVLILLYEMGGELNFILTERQLYNGKHSGQISLPGGKFELMDADLSRTALRETEEEIGIPSSNVELIGALTKIYIPVSNFIVQPFVGIVEEIHPLRPDPREVKRVLHCPVSSLLAENNRIDAEIQISKTKTLKNVPAFKLQEKIVWGATAIILNEFKQILKRI